VADGELSVTLVTEQEIAELHERYMDEPGPTDVLSFPQDDEPAGNGQPRVLGDVVICPAVASRQNAHLDAELRLLLVHGILHLLGYDHQEEEERRRMWDRQEALTGVRP
jgi:probable rRNA maturation factor